MQHAEKTLQYVLFVEAETGVGAGHHHQKSESTTRSLPQPPLSAAVCHRRLSTAVVTLLVTPAAVLCQAGLTVSSKLARYRRVSSGQASSCHSEPKGCGPLRLYLFTLCIALCTTAHSDSHYNSCRSHYKLARCAVVRAEAQGTSQQAMQAGHHSSTRSVTGQSVSSWSNTLACVQYSMGTAATTGVAIAPQN
jgi:hypothetical protein